MWIAFSLVAALGGAGSTLALKRAVDHGGGVVLSTVAFRVVAGVLLLGVVAATAGAWPEPTPGYWRAVALMLPPEVAGMVLLTLALRAGDVSLVQPIFGLLPLFVMAAGALFLNEVPTPAAGAGVVLVAAGVYCVGLGAAADGARAATAPLRAFARSRASWYAVAASLVWGLTAVVHKLGIAQVGPLPWAVTIALGSAAALGLALPVLAWRGGGVGVPRGNAGPWALAVAATGALFALQQVGLQQALGAAQAGYAIAVASTSILIATALGVRLLGERAGGRTRIAGAALVTAGAALIAVFG